MPSIVSQPIANKLLAAYRPIVSIFEVELTTTVPVAFCDVYIDGNYYRTLSKTQPIFIDPGVVARYEFDIQDALKEVMKPYIGPYGGSDITTSDSMLKTVYCKFRASKINVSGFIESVPNAVPVQASGLNPAVSGGGIQGNTFIVINSTLQHKDNQNLIINLNSYKTNEWLNYVFPVTHRIPGCSITLKGTDYFPIYIDDADLLPECIILNYRLKNTNDFIEAEYCFSDLPGCISPLIPAIDLPTALEGTVYSYAVTLIGSTTLTLSNVVKPAWMNIGIVGHQLIFSGTPAFGDIGDDIPVSFDISNGCGTDSAADTLDVLPAGSCIDVASVIGSFPNGRVGSPYFKQIVLTGTQPFTLNILDIPAWMTAEIVSGNLLTFTGVPTVSGADVIISVSVENCASGLLEVDAEILIALANAKMEVSINLTGVAGSPVITNVTPHFFTSPPGQFPIGLGQGMYANHAAYTGTISVVVSSTGPNTMILYKNGIPLETITLNAPGTYTFGSRSYLLADFILIRIEA